MPLLAAIGVQDALLAASNDLNRMQTLLADASVTLMRPFQGVTERIQALRGPSITGAERDSMICTVTHDLTHAVTALQFQDGASQPISHTQRRLRNCADQLARDSFADAEDGEAVVEAAPDRSNPVTPAEMDTGCIGLF